MTGKIISVRVGQIETLPAWSEESPNAKAWQSAIRKQAVSGAVQVDIEGLAGDTVGDRHHHGGEHMAVNVYPNEHYAYWRQTPSLSAMTAGGFGENLTVEGWTEDTICVGDTFRAGSVVFEVSQPREPCFKLSRLWQTRDLMQRACDTNRYGWYFRVLEAGVLQEGDALELLAHPYPQWTIERVYNLHRQLDDVSAALALADCPALSPKWQAALRKAA